MNETPRYRLWDPRSLPMHWVIEDLDTKEMFMFPVRPGGGYHLRKPYRGHRENLSPAWGYNYIGTGVPLRREWKEVCGDKQGVN